LGKGINGLKGFRGSISSKGCFKTEEPADKSQALAMI
jgi:hypothetical protein